MKLRRNLEKNIKDYAKKNNQTETKKERSYLNGNVKCICKKKKKKK